MYAIGVFRLFQLAKGQFSGAQVDKGSVAHDTGALSFFPMSSCELTDVLASLRFSVTAHSQRCGARNCDKEVLS
jgi:hypothetical protein